jgi:hypothetical protein
LAPKRKIGCFFPTARDDACFVDVTNKMSQMEVRRRIPRERSYIHEKQEVAKALESATPKTGHGAINGLLVLLGYLVQLLRSIVYGSRKVDTRQKEDDDEDKSNEEMVLLGSMCRGLIVVHERRRKRSTALVLSSSRHGEMPSVLSHAAAAYAFLGSETHPRLLRYAFYPLPRQPRTNTTL